MIRRILREPLLHFVLLGAALFGSYQWWAVPVDDQSTIIVTADRIASLRAQFTAMHGSRPPAEEELRGMIAAYVRDEMLYREGLALGLDRNDPVIRSRVKQKADMLATDAMTVEPTDADLQAYLDAHRDKFDMPGRITFEQVYFDPDKHRNVERELAEARAALARGQQPESLGDRTMLPSSVTLALSSEVDAQFGEGFTASVARLSGADWQGPVKSPFGLHLVRIIQREPMMRATLEVARVAITREWNYAQQETKRAGFYRELAKRYQVQVEGQPKAPQVADANFQR